MAQSKPPVDLSDKLVSQLYLNDDYLGQGDFVDDDGNFREFKLKMQLLTEEELQMPGRNKKEDKKVLAFSNAKKRLPLNKTNARAIKSHYGEHVADWKGKVVTVCWATHELTSIGRNEPKAIRNPQNGDLGGVRIRPKT